MFNKLIVEVLTKNIVYQLSDVDNVKELSRS
jgi:hypothetical protein